MIDIQTEDLRLVREILRRHVAGLEVRAFGSRVAGRCKPWSDLDLAVVSEEPLSLDVLAALNEDFRESDLSIKVDVLERTDGPPWVHTVLAGSSEVVQRQGCPPLPPRAPGSEPESRR